MIRQIILLTNQKKCSIIRFVFIQKIRRQAAVLMKGRDIMAKQVRLTREGLNKYKEELEELKTVKRVEAAEDLKIARSYGDLSENSEYDAAKDKQAKLEARIFELQDMIDHAVIIEDSGEGSELIHIGSIFKAHIEGQDDDVQYEIVVSNEANPFDGKISDDSPIGKAVIGHSVGSTVEVNLPNGTVVKYKISEIIK